MIEYNIKRVYNSRINYNSDTSYTLVFSDMGRSIEVTLPSVSTSTFDVGSGGSKLFIDSMYFGEESGRSEECLSVLNAIGALELGFIADVAKFVSQGPVVKDSLKATDRVFIDMDLLLQGYGVAEECAGIKNINNYNSRKNYNKEWDDGGASYNSYKPRLVMTADKVLSNDMLSLSFGDLVFTDIGEGNDAKSTPSADLSFKDRALFEDTTYLRTRVHSLDMALPSDMVSLLFKLPASEYFVVDTRGLLAPLGLRVTKDNRGDILPATKENSESIPGSHGEIDFGTELKSKMLELEVTTLDGNTSLEKSQLQRRFAMYLDPTKGEKKLVFSDELEKTYKVKSSGRINPDVYAKWLRFTIPFKMNDPFIYGTLEKSVTGTGVLLNVGTFETGLIVEIEGPVTNPFVNIGEKRLLYSGELLNGQKLIIDTERETAKIGDSNAIASYNGVFPLLYPGQTKVVASDNVVIRWRDKWI